MPVSEAERRAADDLAAGEYGATKIVVTRDGSCIRIAFGRNGVAGAIFTGAVLLSPEAVASLREQLAEIG